VPIISRVFEPSLITPECNRSEESRPPFFLRFLPLVFQTDGVILLSVDKLAGALDDTALEAEPSGISIRPALGMPNFFVHMVEKASGRGRNPSINQVSRAG
jgi:hypothetical protein